MVQWCRLLKRCRNLPAGHCVTVVKAVLAVSESTCLTLCYSDAGCLSNVRNYLPCTVLQGCRLFKRCKNLPAGHCVTVVKAALANSEPTCRHCVAGVQTVEVVSEPTRWALCFNGAGCLSGVKTYLRSTVLQGFRLFKRCQNLPGGHCVSVVQAV